MRYYIETLGCFKNRIESELFDAFLKDEYEKVDNPGDAEIVILNTCTFIEEATQETIDAILKYASYRGKKLIVVGCFGQRYGSEIMREIPEVDGVIGTYGWSSCLDVIVSVMKSKKVVMVSKKPEHSNVDYSVRETHPRLHYSFVKVSDGCNKKCSFCIIPQLKGPLVSRPIESIVKEVEILASRGIREVNIVSQTTTSYGLDLYGNRRLCECIEELVKVEGLRWIRILYTYPGEVGEELLRLISTQEKVCRYLDIPIQHVSDRILKRMRREISGGTIRKRILGIRERYPGIFIRSTLIVGFPQETDREFKELFDFVKEVRFERLGVFPFSREKGTDSFRMRGQIPEEVKQERVRAIMELQAGISLEKNREFIGKVVETVLDEEIGGEYLFDGRTEYDAPEIDNGVLIREGSGVVGEFVPVRICDATEYDLIGEIIDTEGK